MTKAELVDVIRNKAGLDTKAQAERLLDATVQSLLDALAKVTLFPSPGLAALR